MRIHSVYSFEDTSGGRGRVIGYRDGEALLELSNGDCIIKNPEAFCRATYVVSGLQWPGDATNRLDPIRASLREIANDPGLCAAERNRAQAALDALA